MNREESIVRGIRDGSVSEAEHNTNVASATAGERLARQLCSGSLYNNLWFYNQLKEIILFLCFPRNNKIF